MRSPPKASVTLQDVAREAGVSVATVDRALNGRPNVSVRARASIEDAIRRLNYRPNIHASRLARGRPHRIAVLMPTGTNPFMGLVEAEMAAQRDLHAQEGARIEVLHTDVFDGATLARAIARASRQADALAVVALDDPIVREAINDAVRGGCIVATLVSDAPRSLRHHYVGIDNVAAGRTAAHLMGRFLGGRTGRVALVAGSMRLRDHAERHLGFVQALTEEAPRLSVVGPIEGKDDPAIVEPMVRRCLAETPDLVGLYNIGAGTEGIIAALADAPGRGDIVFIAHDLTPATRAALIDGTIDAIIQQDPGHEARSAVRRLLAELDGTPISEGQERIRIDIYVKHNLP